MNFFEEANNAANNSYRTIKSFETFKVEYLGLQQTSLEKTSTHLLRKLRESVITDRSSKGFKRMMGTPTKKIKFEEGQLITT
jgi:hypothetical protein